MPDDAMVYEISHRLADLFPQSFVLETDDYDFELRAYAEDGRCSLHPLESTHAQFQAIWDGQERKILMRSRNAMHEVLWRGKRLHVLSVTYGICDTTRHFILADSGEDARAFFSAVCTWGASVHGEILVFSNGYWKRDKPLMAQIERASLDDLVLPGPLREELIRDFEGFFAGQELYKKHGVAWKRGILLLGPPGNGKTHCIKALVRHVGKPCLYVRSFRPDRGSTHKCMSAVFERAREMAPCMLVLEDLDSLVDDTNRSFFLNEMDGFAENEGILTVATTNHPEKLDPALTERPSRFDRKITFSLPRRTERRRFLALANERREEAARINEAELELLARQTKGFTFAYLKELGLCGLMEWMRDPQPGAMGSVLQAQVRTLRTQMRSEKPSSVKDDE